LFRERILWPSPALTPDVAAQFHRAIISRQIGSRAALRRSCDRVAVARTRAEAEPQVALTHVVTPRWPMMFQSSSSLGLSDMNPSDIPQSSKISSERDGNFTPTSREKMFRQNSMAARDPTPQKVVPVR